MDRSPAPVDRSIGPALRELLDASPKAVRRAVEDRHAAEDLDGGKRAKKEETRRLVSSLDAVATPSTTSRRAVLIALASR